MNHVQTCKEEAIMAAFWLGIIWIVSILVVVITVAMFGMGARIQAMLFVGIVLLLPPPPVRAIIYNLAGMLLTWWARGLLVITLAAGVSPGFVLNPALSAGSCMDRRIASR